MESGIFRSDIPCRFRIVPSAIQRLIDNLDEALQYAIEVEEKRDMSTITNYDEVKAEVRLVYVKWFYPWTQKLKVHVYVLEPIGYCMH